MGNWLVQSLPLGHHGHCGRLGMLFFEGHAANERENDGPGRRGRREIPALVKAIVAFILINSKLPLQNNWGFWKSLVFFSNA